MRDKILQKATDLFLNLGFKSVTMDDLAQDMGISKKTIYTHYKNKNVLVEACSMHVFHQISSGIDQICNLELNPIEELFEIKKFVLHHLKNEKSSPQYQLKKYFPRIYGNLRGKQFGVMQECVISNLEKGIKMGFYRDNLNKEFISRIYFSGITSIKDTDLFPTNKFDIPTLTDDYLEYHIRGIVTPKGRTVLNTILNSTQN